MSELEEYRTRIRAALIGEDERPMFNGSLRHAQIVIEEAFKAASKQVRILSNGLDSECYGQQPLIDIVRQFLNMKETTLSILVEKSRDDVCQGRFYKNFESEIGEGRIKLAFVPAEISDDYQFNFLVVDESAYRFEADRRMPEAVVAGGASAADAAQNLARLFDSLFARVSARAQLQPA